MDFRPELIFSVVLFVWLTILTAFFIRFFLSYSRISKKAKDGNITHLLDELMQKNSENRKALLELSKKYIALENDGKLHIQKVGLLRFNPFKDTGGDQSFILALVDAMDTGVVISGLHTRAGTRWYAKKIVNGKGAEYDLSEDEKKALKEARNNVE